MLLRIFLYWHFSYQHNFNSRISGDCRFSLAELTWKCCIALHKSCRKVAYYWQRGCTLQRTDKQKTHCVCLLLTVSVATGCTDTFPDSSALHRKTMPFGAANSSLCMESSGAQHLPGAQWETLPEKWKRSIRDGLIHFLILLCFILSILTTPKIHNIQLSNFLSFPQGEPVATLHHIWTDLGSGLQPAVLIMPLLHRVKVACEFYVLCQMMVMPIYERPFLYWEDRLDTRKWPGQAREVAAGVPLQPFMPFSAQNDYQQVKKNLDSP